MTRTGGEKTDEALGKSDEGPEGLPHSIIVTPEGIEGEVPVPIVEPPNEAGPPKETPEEEEKAAKRTRPKGRAARQETDRSKQARPTRRVKPTPRHKTDPAEPARASQKAATAGRNKRRPGAKKRKGQQRGRGE